VKLRDSVRRLITRMIRKMEAADIGDKGLEMYFFLEAAN
jgi:hypothetical protein